MHVNVENGEFRFSSKFVLSSRLTEAVFREHFNGERRIFHEENGQKFQISPSFENGKLKLIEFFLDDPKYGTSWHDWSEGKELQRQKDTEK